MTEGAAAVQSVPVVKAAPDLAIFKYGFDDPEWLYVTKMLWRYDYLYVFHEIIVLIEAKKTFK